MRESPPPQPTRLSARSKLGLLHYIVAAVLNPKVGAGSPGIIRRALREGHEVGLHGGRNHASWQSHARKWNATRIQQEVAAGRSQLLKVARQWGAGVRGFASPGWQGPAKLWPILAASGFEYVADTRGRHRELEQEAPPGRLYHVPTHLVGEPGGVAYLEYHHAIGSRTADVVTDFRSALRDDRRSLVLYDHPYYAGIQRLDLLRELIAVGRQAGYRTATLSDLVAAQRAEEEP